MATDGGRRLAAQVAQSDHLASGPTAALVADDIVSYALGGQNHINPETKIWVNALDDSQFITYRQASQEIRALAAGLRLRGLQTGDCVCIHSYNNIYYPILWLGAIAAGGIVTGTNPAYTRQELVHQFNITKTKFLFVHSQCHNTAIEAARECSIRTAETFAVDDIDDEDDEGGVSLTGLKSWRSLLQTHLEDDSGCQFSDEHAQSTTTACYAMTSGTTGLPKAAELSHRYYVAQATAIGSQFRDRGVITQLQCLPIFHAFAGPVAILLPLRLGMTTYLMPRFKLKEYVDAVARYQVTDTAVVPPIAVALRDLPYDERQKLQSLRYVISAGAPMSAEVQNGFDAIFSSQTIIGQCWGATEMGWMTLTRVTERDSTGSVGRPLPNTILRIKDENGNIVTSEGVRGEAFVRSPSMLRRYAAMPDKADVNQNLFDDDGFYGTGDLVYVKNGLVYVDGRAKDIMKVNGWQVSPQELQNVIMQGCGARGVLDCVVVGHNVINEAGLQVTLPRAYVVKQAASSITADDIKMHVKCTLVSYKQLTGGVIFVDQIPRTPTGKILRRNLEQMANEADACSAAAAVSVTKPISPSPPQPVLEISVKDFGWRYYASAVVLIPLCFMLGSPGIILIAAMANRRFR